MKILLIYDNGDEYTSSFKKEEFESEELMLNFVNENNIGDKVMCIYEVCKEIHIEPFERIVNYKLKD